MLLEAAEVKRLISVILGHNSTYGTSMVIADFYCEYFVRDA